MMGTLREKYKNSVKINKMDLFIKLSFLSELQIGIVFERKYDHKFLRKIMF